MRAFNGGKVGVMQTVIIIIRSISQSSIDMKRSHTDNAYSSSTPVTNG